MTNMDSSVGPLPREQAPIIPIQDFDAALADLEFQSPQWYRARFGESCRMCVESPNSRDFMLAILSYMKTLQNTGGDPSTPMVLLGATMLQIGYAIGRKRAEAEVLEGWMKL
jgi:hypothetical protein